MLTHIGEYRGVGLAEVVPEVSLLGDEHLDQLLEVSAVR